MQQAMQQAALRRARVQQQSMAMMQGPMMLDPRMGMMQDPRMGMMQDPRMGRMQGGLPRAPDPLETMRGAGPRGDSTRPGASGESDGRNPFANMFRGRGRGDREERRDRRDPLGMLFGGRDGHGDRHGRGKVSVPGYEVVKALNTGGMSEAVNLVKDKNSGKVFIEKRVRIDGMRKKRTTAELHALQRVERGRNLNYMVKFLWDDRKNFCSFILEYCDEGSLDKMIEKQVKGDKRFKDEFVWHVLVGIAKGLAFLHHGIRDATKDHTDDTWNTICHLDLKPCNIFFSSAGQEGPHPRVVVGDFRCAITKSDIEFGMEHPRQQMCGTPEWYPPEGRAEMVGGNRTRYGTETDIWQMGATIHTMCRLLKGPDPSIYTFPSEWSGCGRRYGERLNGAVMWCCFPKWQKRPSAAKLVREVIKIARDKGMPQLATMRG